MSSLKTVLLIGTAGAEGSLCRFLVQHEAVGQIYLCPGSAGRGSPHTRVLPHSTDDLDGLQAFARQRRIGLVVEGPGGPGVPAALRARGGYQLLTLASQEPLATELWQLLRRNTRVGSWSIAVPRPCPPPTQPQKHRSYACERDHTYTFQIG